jgi:hypothetical protein
MGKEVAAQMTPCEALALAVAADFCLHQRKTSFFIHLRDQSLLVQFEMADPPYLPQLPGGSARQVQH